MFDSAFEILVIALLAASLAAGIAALAALNKIRRSLEELDVGAGSARSEETPAYQPSQTYGAPGEEPYAGGYGAQQGGYEPRQGEYEAGGGYGRTGGYGREEAAAPASQQTPATYEHPLETAHAEAAAAQQAVETQNIGATETAAATPAAQQDPQEQPFERDGRWWFRRGDELLVYDEQSQQWVAAPQSGAGAAPAAVTGQTTSGYASTSTTSPHEGQPEEAGSFWKCPQCGAINGSTATSCRMCFTARPA